jgi:hypothetical protein
MEWQLVSDFWYDGNMNPSEGRQQAYTGHVKNGVIVLDGHVVLDEGQAVRVEPLAQTAVDAERAERFRQLQQLFAEWTQEDGTLNDEEADRLRSALEQSRGLGFRSPALD